MSRTIIAAALLLACLASSSAWADDTAGKVSRQKGEATGTIEGARTPLTAGVAVVRDEVLETGAAARLEITFLDTSQLTLGERAKVRIDKFVYDGSHARALTLAAVGALRFISAGNKPPGAAVMVRTPVVDIGVRGTDFWFGPIDGQFGVLLITGAVTVSNAAGSVILDQPGEGTNITGPGSAPGPVTQWPQPKVERALATVAF